MKKFFGALIVGLLLVSPSVSLADVGRDHGMATPEEHQEMEDLMVKMMTNEMNEKEARKMITLMQNIDGGMMGMMGGGVQHRKGVLNDYNMMGTSLGLIWLIAGVLLIAWLARELRKK
tara:strand:- start:12002 stop:12355 length:354 start_codon:yes stop_codon:yes gene_type:complete